MRVDIKPEMVPPTGWLRAEACSLWQPVPASLTIKWKQSLNQKLLFKGLLFKKLYPRDLPQGPSSLSEVEMPILNHKHAGCQRSLTALEHSVCNPHRNTEQRESSAAPHSILGTHTGRQKSLRLMGVSGWCCQEHRVEPDDYSQFMSATHISLPPASSSSLVSIP